MEGRQAVSDLIQLRIGERPWLPAPGTEAIEIFDRYDMPTSGLVKQDERFFVFDCVEGHVMSGNVWIYVEVSQEEAQALRDAEGEEFSRLFDRVFVGRAVMAALAVDCRIRSGSQVDPDTIAKEGLMKGVLERLREGAEIAGETAKAMKHLVTC